MTRNRLLPLALLIAALTTAFLAAAATSDDESEPRPRIARKTWATAETEVRRTRVEDEPAPRARTRQAREGGVVRGQVVDSRGRVVAQAMVMPFGRGLRRVPAIRTDENGRFELKGVPLESEGIRAEHPHYLQGEFKGVFAEGRTEAVVELRLGDAADLEGVVLDPWGEPIAGAAIRRGRRPVIGGSRAAVRTADDGLFLLLGLDPEKELTLVATHPEFGDSAPVRIRPDGRPVLRLSLPGEVRGLVVDSDGRPVARAQVEIAGRKALSDADGHFTLRNLPEGQNKLLAWDRHSGAERELELRGGDQDVGRIVLPSVSALAGTAVDSAGRPVGEARVFAQCVDGDARRLRRVSPGRVRNRGRADEQGDFRLDGMRPGRYELIAVADGMRGRIVVENDGAPVRIVLEPAS